MLKSRWSQLTELFGKRPCVVVVLLPCLLIFTLYLISGRYLELNNYMVYKSDDFEDELVNGYLVWNPKCHMLSKSPMDPTIKKYVKKQKYESCSNGPLLSSIEREINGTYFLVINQNIAKKYKKFTCCWTEISRTIPQIPLTKDWDTKINIGECQDFVDRVSLPFDLEIVMISCRKKNAPKQTKSALLYQNIHAIINPGKIQDRLNTSTELSPGISPQDRKMSVLILGIDSVSRLNFERSLPKTSSYLRENGWYDLKGYNKIADNTYPNLMAILTGQNQNTAYAKCTPSKAYGLDNCPFIWHNFRNAGYVTAYGEDVIPLSTFNYIKVGFVNPPTDYYLRPYILATEKLLKIKKRFSGKYCTGPELAVDRIYNYALNFAKTFIGKPYFGFFWTNTVSHDEMNGPSSMDEHFLNMFKQFDDDGITNDTIMIFLSDHGMRWGGIRDTFVGWYEERLPFIYLKFPDWVKQDSSIFQALRINEHRLTSPYDLYETLGDILNKSGGSVNPSSGCPTCQSLLKPVPIERGCDDAGVSPHWCACTAFKPGSTSDKIAKNGAKKFIDYVEDIVKNYRNKKGKRLCAKLKIKTIMRVDKIIDLKNTTFDGNTSVEGYFYLVEVTPGGAKFEFTIRVQGDDNFVINDNEISRINSYAESAKCLDHGKKQFCHCLK